MEREREGRRERAWEGGREGMMERVGGGGGSERGSMREAYLRMQRYGVGGSERER